MLIFNKRLYIFTAILAVIVFTAGLWNLYLTWGFLTEMKGWLGAIKFSVYPGFFILLLCILFLIGVFKKWYWNVVITFIFSIQITITLVPRLTNLGGIVSNDLALNTFIYTYGLLSLFLANAVLFIMMSLLKYFNFCDKRNQ